MAELEVRVINGATASQPIYTTTAVNPAIKGAYLYSMANAPGTAEPQNFITLMNPIGSGKTLALASVSMSYSNIAPATNTEPMRGWRITDSTAGTLVGAGSIAKFMDSHPTPVGVVRVDNPTVVLDKPIFNSPPPIDNRSSNVHTVDVPPGIGFFSMNPGQGIGIRKESGVTSASWNITVVWVEI